MENKRNVLGISSIQAFRKLSLNKQCLKALQCGQSVLCMSLLSEGVLHVELHIHVQKANDRRKCRHTELLTEELWTHIPKVQDGSLKRNLEVKNIHVHKCVI